MPQRPAAEIGMLLPEVDTPAMLIDLDAYERNLDRMAALMAGSRKRFRPHAKMHKSPQVALDQIARGAVGVCCQKVSEAEIMVAGGIGDVLITNQVVVPAKLRRLANLASKARIAVCCDDAGAVALLNAACAVHGVRMTALVEIDVGAGRCGVAGPQQAVALAQVIVAMPFLSFGGLQAYHGSAQHLRSPEERANAIDGAATIVSATVQALALVGLGCSVVTGGGTGTLFEDLQRPEWTELQCGSYAVMDADYARNRPSPDAGGHFEHALFILTTIISAARAGHAVADAGLKAVASDSGDPTVFGRPDLGYALTSDEHGNLTMPPSVSLRVGERLHLVPGHCDPTINLHDWFIGLRGDRVERVWPVVARGALL